MGPKKPEIEWIDLNKVRPFQPLAETQEAHECLRRLARNALKSGPFNIVKDKTPPHIAASNDPHDFLSYAPYWWPIEKTTTFSDGTTETLVDYVRKDGKRNPDTKLVQDQSQLEAFAENLSYLCLGYRVFGDESYAQRSVLLLTEFFINPSTRMNPHVKYGQVVRGSSNKTGIGRYTGLISTRSLARVANVLPLLEDYPGYKQIQEDINQWFSLYLTWIRTDPVAQGATTTKNNHHSWYIVQVVAIQILLDRGHCKAKRTLETFFKSILPKQIASNGDQPLESNRTLPFHYLVFNIKAILFLAQAGRSIGLDFYSQNNRLIELAVNYIVSFGDTDAKSDLTEAVRVMQIASNACGDTHGAYQNFVTTAKSCQFSENITGPKNAIHPLWCYVDPDQVGSL
ncbi:putative alginate lyase [Phycomyces nitens]|nr:putative alginate lyase [Phycomyces nitens]